MSCRGRDLRHTNLGSPANDFSKFGLFCRPTVGPENGLIWPFQTLRPSRCHHWSQRNEETQIRLTRDMEAKAVASEAIVSHMTTTLWFLAGHRRRRAVRDESAVVLYNVGAN